jgi:hypothetical protein
MIPSRKQRVGSTRLGTLVWPGMVLAGLLLMLAVWASWPEPSTRLVRLPYGESQPKAPLDERATRQVAVAPSVEQPRQPGRIAQPEAEEEPARVLAGAGSAPATEEADLADGPAPVPSPAELQEDYVQESPEELGARPLPGADATPVPPVAG